MADPNKPYELTLEMRPGYLYAHVRSETTSQAIAVGYLHEIIDRCKKLDRSRLLLERDIPATLGEDEVYFSGTDFAHTGLEDIKIAVIDHRPENAEHLELAILVQNNRGANIQLFDNADEAEAWLLKPLPHLRDT
jgi:hypothetical protein